MKNKSNYINKKSPVIEFILLVGGGMIISVGFVFLQVGLVPVEDLVLMIAIVLPFVIMGIIGYTKNKKVVRVPDKLFSSHISNKFRYVYLFLGLILGMTSTALIFIGEGNNLTYTQLVIGIAFTISALNQIRKSTNNETR